MRRFYLEEIIDQSKLIQLTDEVAHHIFHVLRLKNGNKVIFFDGKGSEYVAELIFDQNCRPQAKILEVRQITERNRKKVILAQALIANSKFEQVLQKTTELGVDTIIPFTSERSVKLTESKRISKKMARYEKIVAEAARQSERAKPPRVTRLASWSEVIENREPKVLKLIAWAREPAKHLKIVLQTTDNYDKILLIIGPEGGFSEKEILAATDYGFIPINLGKLILRTETAGPAAMAMISFHFSGESYG